MKKENSEMLGGRVAGYFMVGILAGTIACSANLSYIDKTADNLEKDRLFYESKFESFQRRKAEEFDDFKVKQFDLVEKVGC